MTFDVSAVYPYKSGLSNYYKPFLIGNDAFETLENAYVTRGVVKKREGSTVIGRLPIWKTAGSITAATPVIVNATNHGLQTGDMVYLENVINSTLSLVVPSSSTDVKTSFTTAIPHGLADGQTVTFSGITGTIGTFLNDISPPFRVDVTGANTFTINILTTGLIYTAGGTVYLGALNNQAFNITRINANSFSLQVLNNETPTNVPNAGPAVSADIYLPVVGSRTYVNTATANEQLVVFHPKKAFLYNTGTQVFDDISFSIGGTITGITIANPAVITTTNNHGLQTGDQIVITGVGGTMGPAINGITFTVTVLSPTTFSIPVNTAGLVFGGGGVVGILWTGTKDNFFYYSNYAKVLWTTNNVDHIRYWNGVAVAGWADFYPAVSGRITTPTFLNRALMILPYKGRLVALSTTETIAGIDTIHFQRARWCQVGTPFTENPSSGFSADLDSWADDIPGKGGFIDADTSERIISAEIIQDTLIVGFQFSTWRLRYTGNEILPFLWERVDTQFGSEATFSAVAFDNAVLMISRRGIVAATFNDVQRIDLDIPDVITSFESGTITEALSRIQGIRDFERRLVFWIYCDNSGNFQSPNKILAFNYQDNTWSIFNQSFTTLGRYKITQDNTWQTWTTTWQGDTSQWNDPIDGTSTLITVAGAKDSRVWWIMNANVSQDEGVNFNFNITTNLINPYFKEAARCKLAFYDLYATGTDTCQVTVENFTGDSTESSWLTKTVRLTSTPDVNYYRVYLGMIARNHQITITLSEEQLADPNIGSADFELQGVLFHTRKAGRIKG